MLIDGWRILQSRDRLIRTFYKHMTSPTVYGLSTVKYDLCRSIQMERVVILDYMPQVRHFAAKRYI